eukprot:TRINITY_DN438_c0_g1_i1.p1 TRINITY_DN438_c0_g1~~TRINITY_DN438_c0_g1_i1.p1  ORF type:complete len:562 (+),score=119.93 TRINITY_DN438_c0_g1_i1:50-1687(+)
MADLLSGIEEGELEESHKRVADEAFKVPKKRRLEKKLRQKLSKGTAPAQVYHDIYGAGAHASICGEVTKFDIHLKAKHIQDLALFICDAAIKPSWILIKNKPLVQNVLILFASGVSAMEADSSLSFLGRPFSLQLPGSNTHAYPLESVLMRVPLSNAAKKKAREFSAATSATSAAPASPTPLHSLILSTADLQVHKYPHMDQQPTFVSTALAVGTAHELVAVDCEMVITEGGGYELARLAIVAHDGTQLLDTLVLPQKPVTDYLTQYSGIDADVLKDVTVTFQQAQEQFLQIVSANTIVVGHSLENDLNALRVCHQMVADTAILFADQRGATFKPALKWLANRYLSTEIQRGSHNPVEDARTALALFNLKREHGPTFGSEGAMSDDETEPLMGALSRTQRRGVLIGRAEVISKYAAGGVDVIPVESDDRAIEQAVKFVQQSTQPRAVICTWLNDLYTYNRAAVEAQQTRSRQEVLNVMFGRIRTMWEALPSDTLVVLVGTANICPLQRLLRQRREGKEAVPRPDTELHDLVAAARAGVSYVAIKS